MTDKDAEIKTPDDVDIVKLKADYENAINELNKAKETIGTLESEKAQLNAYIAKYVSSNTPSNNGGVVEKKSFNDMYIECLKEMENKKE